MNRVGMAWRFQRNLLMRRSTFPSLTKMASFSFIDATFVHQRVSLKPLLNYAKKTLFIQNRLLIVKKIFKTRSNDFLNENKLKKMKKLKRNAEAFLFSNIDVLRAAILYFLSNVFIVDILNSRHSILTL